jgi:energy-converting hydrogenase Eha subunit A
MRISPSIVCLSFICEVATAQVKVINPLTENLKNPLNTDNSAPRFSWQPSEKSGTPVLQQAYEIEVDSTDIMGDKVAYIWSRGQVVQSDQSLYVPYREAVFCNRDTSFSESRSDRI